MIVEIKNLIKRYNDVLAVDNVSFSIKEGEIFGLLGPNGAGKTTTINALLGLIGFDSGEIKIFGKSLKESEKEIKRNIGIVPQDIALYEDLTVLENIKFFGGLYGLKKDELNRAIEETLQFTELTDKKNMIVKKLSGGIKRRVNIACGIVHKPKLIVMDEPTVGIDAQSRNHILNSIKKLNEMGATVIYTSHYMEEVEQICSYVVIIDKGRVIAKGTKEELKALIAKEDKISIEVLNVNYSMVDDIKRIDGVIGCDINDRFIYVISKKGSRNLTGIIDAILKNDGEIVSINNEKPTLEGVFLTLTGKSLRD